MSAEIENMQTVRALRTARQLVCETGDSNLASKGVVKTSEDMKQRLNGSQKHENGGQSPLSVNGELSVGAQIAAKKSNRKRKSYYLNEMLRLGVDPIAPGCTMSKSELENVENCSSKNRRLNLLNNNHQNGTSTGEEADQEKSNNNNNLAMENSEDSKSSEIVCSRSKVFDISTHTSSNGASDGCSEKSEISSKVVENGTTPLEKEHSSAVNVSIVSEPEAVKPSRTRPNPFKLIRCEKYGENEEAPFQLFVSVEAITIIDVHAHCVQNEVIGLLGGKYCPLLCKLHIYTAVPCESITSSTTDLQCEMDPVSQALASEKLNKDGYNVVGWYHSHPTFLPNPSLRDLETQEKYQQLFAEGKQPFVALILSPYSTSMHPTQKNSYVSKYKCLMVSDQQNSQGDYRIPYEFSPQLIRREKLVYNVLSSISELRPKIASLESALCLSDKVKGRDIQYIQKLMASLKHHLEVTGLSNKESEHLVQCLKDILMKNEASEN